MVHSGGMIRPPFLARVAAGIALTVAEEVRELPTTAVALPMTSVSMLLQSSMRLQQTMTSLAIKGDEAFAFLYPDSEQPSWAVFDEDEVADPAPGAPAASAPARNGSSAEAGSLGRFALYSTPHAAARGRARDVHAESVSTEVPDAVEAIGYDDLTLAQLRSRLRGLPAEDLADLLEYERSGAARAPYLTMLENRLTSVTAK